MSYKEALTKKIEVIEKAYKSLIGHGSYYGYPSISVSNYYPELVDAFEVDEINKRELDSCLEELSKLGSILLKQENSITEVRNNIASIQCKIETLICCEPHEYLCKLSNDIERLKRYLPKGGSE